MAGPKADRTWTAALGKIATESDFVSSVTWRFRLEFEFDYSASASS